MGKRMARARPTRGAGARARRAAGEAATTTGAPGATAAAAAAATAAARARARARGARASPRRPRRATAAVPTAAAEESPAGSSRRRSASPRRRSRGGDLSAFGPRRRLYFFGREGGFVTAFASAPVRALYVTETRAKPSRGRSPPTIVSRLRVHYTHSRTGVGARKTRAVKKKRKNRFARRRGRDVETRDATRLNSSPRALSSSRDIDVAH